MAYGATCVAGDADGGMDWDRSLAFRRHIWGYGLGVAEAMDTAQRGIGLDWETAKQLITLSLAEARAVNRRIFSGPPPDPPPPPTKPPTPHPPSRHPPHLIHPPH